jgi:hypothetical protein
MNVRRALALTLAVALVASVARSGHELPVYPSYYPHEIEIATLTAQQAAERLPAGKLHAYVGGSPPLASPPAGTIGAVESLGAFVIVRLNPDSSLAKDDTSACAALPAIMRDMAAGGGRFIVHPYPVTPFHGDYLQHADRAEAAKQRVLRDAAAALSHDVKVRAASALAKGLVPPGRLADGPRWDAAIEEVGAAHLVADATVALNGWMGPRWTRSGWFHAYRLLSASLADPVLRQEVEASAERLQAADYAGPVERINLERDLVQRLASGCRAAVAGYTVKREYLNVAFSAGVENIGFDALEGLASPMFLRTVKLKDFPWNGWLQLGLEAKPASAWNPIGGFTDPFGRLMWFALADPALIPSPYEAGWMLNRISDVEASSRR